MRAGRLSLHPERGPARAEGSYLSKIGLFVRVMIDALTSASRGPIDRHFLREVFYCTREVLDGFAELKRTGREEKEEEEEEAVLVRRGESGIGRDPGRRVDGMFGIFGAVIEFIVRNGVLRW